MAVSSQARRILGNPPKYIIPPQNSIASLTKLRCKNQEQLDTPYVLHSGDLQIQDGTLFLPLCMPPLLVDDEVGAEIEKLS